ncbi:MAG: MlaD family protein [Akkermansiaceae bacterium]|nr:MlaD family protein [Akkermansiaceae bacterium]
MSETPTEYQPTIRKRRRISSVWLVPALAFLLAGWLIWKNNIDKGPLVTIRFDTAEGIASGKTEVRCRSVPVGMVERVTLTDSLQADVEVRVRPDYADLLRSDSRFWVVRPRVSTSNVSGLGTLITGAYLELDPGTLASGQTRYIGLEEPPVTSSSVPGLRLTLVADDAGSLTVGSPIYHRGFEVGKVERRALSLKNRNVQFNVFIADRYASLVRKGTRFWNNSGIDLTASSEGFKFRTPSVQAIVTGGATFSTPEENLDSPPAGDGDFFTLYEDQTAAEDSHFEPDRRALLFFDQSVRGLTRGASVEFRGIQVGRVVEVSFKHSSPGDTRVPVLIEFDTRSLHRTKPLESGEEDRIDLAEAVHKGLRAKLASASLITGALFIDLDFDAESPPMELGKSGDFDVIPTVPGGFAKLEEKLNAILTKLEALPLDETLVKFGKAADETAATVAEARETLTAIETTLADAQKILGSDDTQNVTVELNKTLVELRQSIESLGPAGAVQGDLRLTLDELRSALRAFEKLSNSIDEEPNSLLFGRESSGDPIPRARR